MNLKPYLGMAIILALAGCNTMSKEDDSALNYCIESGRIVSAAKRSYQLGHNVPDGTPVTWADLSSCLPGGWRPVCVKGGIVQPGRIGEEMTCSYHKNLQERLHDW